LNQFPAISAAGVEKVHEHLRFLSRDLFQFAITLFGTEIDHLHEGFRVMSGNVVFKVFHGDSCGKWLWLDLTIHLEGNAQPESIQYAPKEEVVEKPGSAKFPGLWRRITKALFIDSLVGFPASIQGI
jgi:hypothetical protein